MATDGNAALTRGAGQPGGSRILTPARGRRDHEARARAEIASIAMTEAEKIDEVSEKRATLLLARAELLKSLGCLEEWLERIPA
jgi:hypothetical protein